MFDDIDESMSSKFQKHDLIGCPFQIVVGSKSKNDEAEFKEIDNKINLLKIKEIINKLKN